MIDEDELARQTAGDTDLQLELLILFLAQLADLETRIDAVALATPDASATDLPAVLHRVRGAASAVGARELAVCLGRAEESLAVSPVSSAAMDGLRAEMAAASAALACLIAGRQGL